MFRSVLRYPFAFVLFALFACLAGCGGGDASVSGTVTFEGTLIEDGSISFVPEQSGGKPVGAQIANGKYSIPSGRGLVPGKYKVEIIAHRKPDPKRGSKVDPDVTSAQVGQYVPQKYNKTTTLSADIKSGSNEDVDFTLTK